MPCWWESRLASNTQAKQHSCVVYGQITSYWSLWLQTRTSYLMSLKWESNNQSEKVRLHQKKWVSLWISETWQLCGSTLPCLPLASPCMHTLQISYVTFSGDKGEILLFKTFSLKILHFVCIEGILLMAVTSLVLFWALFCTRWALYRVVAKGTRVHSEECILHAGYWCSSYSSWYLMAY